jgi:hypothetical protein
MFQRVSLQKAQTQRFQYYLSTRGFVFVKKCLDKKETPVKAESSHTKGKSKYNSQVGLYVGYVLMILPQVHLRKPCYDFYFL